MLVTAGSWNTEATGEGLRAGEYTGRAPKAGTRPAAHNTRFCDRFLRHCSARLAVQLGGYRGAHHHRAVTVGNKAPAPVRQVPTVQSRQFCPLPSQTPSSTPVRSADQGRDPEGRITYWCPSCQS
jgi:hypothetical protein